MESEKLDRTLNYVSLNRYSIKDLREYAQAKGGDCLSKIYTNSDKRYKWICSEGHTWFSTFNSVYHKNTWCPICAKHGGGIKNGYKKHEIKIIIKKLNWKIISYYGEKKYVSIQCQHGHNFQLRLSKISENAVCPICEKKSKQELLLSKIYEIIESKNGQLLSNSDDITQIKNTIISCSCKEGHIFNISLNNLINRDCWCKICANNERRYKLMAYHILKEAQ